MFEFLLMTGLLIEADPASHEELLTKNRNAYILPMCLSPNATPSTQRFKLDSYSSGISETHIYQNRKDFMSRPDTILSCFPLGVVLEAIGVQHVDYFSLDVEGSELDILRSIDYERIVIDVFTIEFDNGEALKGYREFFEGVLNKTGVRYEEILQLVAGSGGDVVFKRK